MGKGSRARARRQQAGIAGLAHADDYPLEVDARTRQELGQQGLAVLADNLWPKDCQSCGWAIGTECPTVLCQDLGAFAHITLHHRRCQPARWSDDMMMHTTGAELVSYDVLSFMLPGHAVTADGTPAGQDDRPVFFVNPNLESLMLTQTAAGWTNRQLDNLHHAGLHPPGPTMLLGKPVPKAAARLDIGELTVTLPPGQSWSCPINVPFREAVEDLGGVLLAVTSAMVPSQMAILGEFIDLVKTNRLALGWIQLVDH